MKLGLKIIFPILLLLLIILGAFGYLLYNLKQQETVISEQQSRIQKLNGLNERLVRQQEQTDYNVLSYRFNQDKAFLLEISQAGLDKSKTLDEMFPFITSSKGRELVNNYIDSRKEVESLRNDLINAIDEGNKEQINQSYNKWSIQTQNIKAALSDIGAYNINSLEKTLAAVGAIRDKIAQIIVILVLVVIVVVILFYFYLRVFITSPLIRLAQFADEIAHKNFTTTTTTTTGINSNDEIGMLARSFNTMSTKLKTYYAELEQTVKAKTEELSLKVLDLEDSKKATLNVLEDLEVAKNHAEILANDLEKFKLALDNASDVVVITDPEGIMLYGNKSIEKITGYKPEEAIGKKSGILWNTPMPQEYYQKMWDTIKNQKKTFVGELQNKRKNGEIYTAIINISPIVNKKGEIEFFVAIERDITREKEIDRMKTEFISLASHQLRTPLTAMKWIGEMLLSGDAGKLKREQEEYVQNIYNSNERMIALVNSLLNISRMESGRLMVEPCPTDLAKLVKDVLGELGIKIKEKKLNLIVSLHPRLPKINIDPKLVRNIYMNLLTNAIKYTPEKGEISVFISKRGNQIVSQVSDTGVGIPQKEQSRIFSKFFRGENIIKLETDGTGLGLYLVKSIVESSKGKIWFESSPKGTTFWFSLPVTGVQAQKGEVTIEC